MSSFSLHGVPVSRGIAIGRAHMMTPASLDVRHYLVTETQIELEVGRMNDAVEAVRHELQTLRNELPREAPAELGAFIDVHLLILSDPMLSQEPLAIIRERHYNAEWALVTQINELSAQFDDIEDPYLRERKSDVQQVGERLVKVLTGNAAPLPPTSEDRPIDDSFPNIIVVAHDISPADMLQFRDHAFAGFVTDLGGPNSHTAIVARSLDIPASVGMGLASTLIRQNDWVIIDGDHGVIIVEPSQFVLQYYRGLQSQFVKTRRKLSKIRKTPAVTQDGVPITLLANIELPDDCEMALEKGAVGVGLFRSEFLFMGRIGVGLALPDEEEQFVSYANAVRNMKGRPVTIRTLDIGADKPLDARNETALNPALGLRAIRFCLAEPQLFVTQLRAILRASAVGTVRLLIPMLAHAREVDQALRMIEQAKAQLRAAGIPFDEQIQIGAMIEIPAAALALPMFIRRLDFLSIGTNDLIQYTLAIDRADHEVAHLYDPLHPAVLYLLAQVIGQARKAGISVAVCGEMAGDVKFTALLLGMGLQEFSMHPAQLLSVKQAVLESDTSILRIRLRRVMRALEPEAIHEAVAALRLPY